MANSISNISENIQIFGMLVLSQLRNMLALVGNVASNYPGAAEPTSAGSIINVPSLAISGSARTRAINGAVTVDDMSSGNVQVTMTQVYKAVKLDNLQRTFSNIDLITETAKRLAIILADGADAQLTGLWYYIPYETGKTDGTATFNSTDKMNYFASARKVLTNNKAPLDRLQAVLGPTESYNLRTLDLFQQAQQRGDTTGLRDGNLGRVMGFGVRESQATPATVTLTTAASWGTPLVNNASGYAIGSTSIAVDGLGTGTIKQGSIFVLGGNNYSVAADATITTNAATLTITPPLKTAVADNDPLTVTGFTHSAAGSVGFAYDPDAFLMVVRPQADFIEGSGVRSYQFSDPESGLSFRLSFSSAIAGGAGTAMQETMVADLLIGCAVVRPELAVRIAGQV